MAFIAHIIFRVSAMVCLSVKKVFFVHMQHTAEYCPRAAQFAISLLDGHGFAAIRHEPGYTDGVNLHMTPDYSCQLKSNMPNNEGFAIDCSDKTGG
ncbi:hypothetical protein LJC22_04210 [Desulfosarcina sp. OttesenSCG-928-G10]|nr:hypothetical protein [Desulfosarcina sp. OttesenSCG-928-G10]